MLRDLLVPLDHGIRAGGVDDANLAQERRRNGALAQVRLEHAVGCGISVAQDSHRSAW